MSNLLVVARREFIVHIRQRGFLLTSLGMPILFLVILIVPNLMGGGAPPEPTSVATDAAGAKSGVVDQADIIREIPTSVPEGLLQPFDSEAQAADALMAGQIGDYYVIERNYRQTGSVLRVSESLPISPPGNAPIEQTLTANLLPDLPAEELSRLRRPFGSEGMASVRLDTQQGQAQSGLPVLPFILTMAIVTPLFTGGGYLFRSLTDEKKNRVLEILLVSLRPRQLLVGKVIGVACLVLVQYLAWILIAALVSPLIGGGLGNLLGGFSISTEQLLLAIPYGLGGFMLYAGLMAGIGALAENAEETRVWVFVLTLPMLIPIYLWSAIASAPNGALAVGLSLFPFSAPVAMTLRLTMAEVPMWQVLLGIAFLLVVALGMMVLMARLFRAHTLLSGEPLSLHRVREALLSG
ncbi:MAG: ABC transporter permease [Anaerolineales bacterium]